MHIDRSQSRSQSWWLSPTHRHRGRLVVCDHSECRLTGSYSVQADIQRRGFQSPSWHMRTPQKDVNAHPIICLGFLTRESPETLTHQLNGIKAYPVTEPAVTRQHCCWGVFLFSCGRLVAPPNPHTRSQHYFCSHGHCQQPSCSRFSLLCC